MEMIKPHDQCFWASLPHTKYFIPRRLHLQSLLKSPYSPPPPKKKSKLLVFRADCNLEHYYKTYPAAPQYRRPWCREWNYWLHVKIIIIKACVRYFLFFHQMIALQKLWKILFISSKKLFFFSRYLNFCIFFQSFPHFPFQIQKDKWK